MISAFAVTYAVEDPIAAARELAYGIRTQLSFGKNSCAILFAEIAFDLEQLLPELEAELGITVIGCTATAQISHLGYHRLSATLLVLTADDCNFGTAMSNSLQGDSSAQITRTYHNALTELDGDAPKLIFILSSPENNLIDEDIISTLNVLSNSRPVFGGVASDYNTFDRAKVFLGSEIRSDGVVMLLISGNINPQFITCNLTPVDKPSHSRVTSSCGNKLLRIDHQNAFDYLQDRAIEPDNPFSFLFNPISVDFYNQDDYDGHAVVRAIYKIDEETKSAITSYHIPEDSSIEIRSINSSDIEDSARKGFSHMRTQILDAVGDHYKYSTLLGISCIARHVVLCYDYEREGILANQILPDGINFLSFYSYGEFCPTSVIDNEARNRLHNLSIAFCLF